VCGSGGGGGRGVCAPCLMCECMLVVYMCVCVMLDVYVPYMLNVCIVVVVGCVYVRTMLDA